MNIIDDIFHLIFEQSNNLICFLVCKKWHNIILKKSVICEDCHKMIKFYNMELRATLCHNIACHTHIIQKTEYNIVKVDIKDVILFKTFLQSYNNYVNNVITITFCPIKKDNPCMVMGGLNYDETTMLKLECYPHHFSNFTCTKIVKICVDVEELLQCMKTLCKKDNLSIIIYGHIIHNDTPVIFGETFIKYTSKGTIFTKKIIIKDGLDIIQIPSLEFDAIITMDDREYNKILEFINGGKVIIGIECYPNQLIIDNGNWWMNRNAHVDHKKYKYKNNEKIVDIKFARKDLEAFGKCIALSDKVKLHMRNNFLLLITCKIPALGEFNYMISPLNHDPQ